MSNDVISELIINSNLLSKVTSSEVEDLWSTLSKKSSFISSQGIEFLKNGLIDDIQDIIIEYPYDCKDHNSLFVNFYNKKMKQTKKMTERLHFFNHWIEGDIRDIDSDILTESYVGFAVIRDVYPKCISKIHIDYRKLSRIKNKNIYLLSTQTKTHLLGSIFKINNFPFLIQDGDITLCSHASLWMICRYLSTRYSIYKDIYPFELVSSVSPRNGRRFPNRGMQFNDYSEVLNNFGTHPIITRFNNEENDKELQFDYSSFFELYLYIESGFPIIASLGRETRTEGHSVVIIGHDISYNKVYDLITNSKKDMQNLYIDTANLVTNLYCMDDNKFPYQELTWCNRDSINEGPYWIENIQTIVCPLPDHVYIDANTVSKIFDQLIDKYKSDLLHLNNNPWIRRIYLTTSTSFRNVKKNFINISSSEIDYINSYIYEGMRLPRFIWVMELSTPNGYLASSCFSEIVIDSSANSHNSEELFIYCRIGNTLYLNERKQLESEQFIDKTNKGKYKTISSSGLTFRNNPITFNQFRHNLA